MKKTKNLLFFFTSIYFFEVKIGTSRVQVGQEYYKQQLRSLIGFGIHVMINGERKCINVDLVSRSLTQTAYDVVCAFR